SAWVAVTDKVATDAAAAAAGALALAQTKADASVVSSLTTRVSDAEGKLTSQATKLEGMQTSIDGKASSQALQQVTSRVTATEDKDKAQDQLINSQSQALTSLTDSVSKKADASTVQALGNMVTQQGQELTAQGQSLTKIDAALGQVGGENLVYNPSFDKEDPATPLVADGWWYDSSGTSVTRVPSLVSSTLAPGLAQHLDVTGLTSSTWARIYGRANRRFKVAPGKTYTASVYLRGTAGLRILPQVYGVSDAGVGSNSWAGVRVDASDTWARLSVTFTADANTAQVYPAFVVYGGASASAGFIEGDQYQIEEGALATGWRDNGQVNSGNQASTATAVEALNAKVTQQGADLASTSSKTTSLENSLNTTNGNVAVAQAAAQNAATLAGSKGRVIVQSAAPDVADRLSQNLWIDTTGNANTPKRWTGTAWQVVTDKVATDAAAAAQSALSQVALKADSSALQTLGSTVSQQGQQIAADGQAITRIDASLNQVKSETASNASATSAITGRVNATEAGLTSVSGQLTEVSNSIGDVGGENLVYNSSFEEQDPGTPGLGNGWWYDGSAGTRVPSLVASTFATGMAQRLDITGLSASTWARLYVKQSMRFKVTPGKTYTASVYVRGTPGLRVLAQVYNLDGSGSNTTSWASARKDAALEWARLSVTFIPTSDTVLLYPAVVVYGGATATSGFIEADHYQVEEGGRATGWRDNGQVIAASNSVTSKAVDSLTSAVNQQGANLSSVSGRTTSLENGLNITNGNLASAQQAAQAAATAAGAKGEVIYSATTPAAEKRLVQNLWIDTTGNANTPKRWSGSAWVAVTDKVATDAAAAAANALAEVAKKADASAVSALNSEV
uniref:carbohydrate binding domain-containing protein n=1 Tax=Pseudomonas fulva TaxID=47880 RepID=UPI002480A1F3